MKDPVWVSALSSGGALLSYEKRAEIEEEMETITYIHTLNTASGFARKLVALRLDLGLFFPAGAHCDYSRRLVAQAPGHDTERTMLMMRAICCIIGYIEDDLERNASASYLLCTFSCIFNRFQSTPI